jgi:hypothetical protein
VRGAVGSRASTRDLQQKQQFLDSPENQAYVDTASIVHDVTLRAVQRASQLMIHFK